MRMSRGTLLLLVAAAILCSHSPASALGKHSVAFDDLRSGAWNAGTTCRVNYYNICTGWVWCWYGFEDQFRFGVVSETCCGPDEPAVLCQSFHLVCTGSPSTYGFTGSIGVYAVDANDCPVEPPIQTQSYLPSSWETFQTVNWGCVPVPSRFAIVITMSDGFGGTANPAEFGSDHPAAGPTGPEACGACYPASRPNHSFTYGAPGSPICPGSTFNDGLCDAQLIWDVDLSCTVSVEETSWGKIKGLYR